MVSSEGSYEEREICEGKDMRSELLFDYLASTPVFYSSVNNAIVSASRSLVNRALSLVLAHGTKDKEPHWGLPWMAESFRR